MPGPERQNSSIFTLYPLIILYAHKMVFICKRVFNGIHWSILMVYIISSNQPQYKTYTNGSHSHMLSNYLYFSLVQKVANAYSAKDLVGWNVWCQRQVIFLLSSCFQLLWDFKYYEILIIL
jgi:hypothetical protein